MNSRTSVDASTDSELPALLLDALDRLEEGVAVFNSSLNLVYCNAPFRELRSYPDEVCRRGAHISALYRHNAERGDYGDRDRPGEVARRVALAHERTPRAFDLTLSDGTMLHTRYAPVPSGGLLFSYEDVTAKRRTESALADSERRAAFVTEATTEGVYEWDIKTHQFHATPRLTSLMGFETGDFTSSQWDWNRRVHPDDFDSYREALTHALKDDDVRYCCEYRVARRDGEYMWIMDRGVVSERDEQGRALRFIGSVLDITDTKLAQERLRVSEQRFALAVEAVNEGVYDWDIANDAIYYSDKVRAVLGLTPEQLSRPNDWTDRLHPEDLPEYRRLLVAHFKGETPRFECEVRYQQGDGSWGWARQHGIVFRDENGRAFRMTGATGDISEQKAMAAELETLRARLLDALETISEGFLLTDADDHVVMFNSKYVEIFGRAAGEDISDLVRMGRPFEEMIREGYTRGMFPAHPDGVDGWVAQRLARHRNPPGPIEFRLTSDQWLHINERTTGDGGTVGVYTDITDLKQREAELARQRAILEVTMENMVQGISMVDADLNVVAFNSRFLALMDFPPEQFRQGFPMEQAFRFNARRGEYGPGEVEQQVRERVSMAARFEPHRFQRVRSDGVVLEIVGTPIEDGGFVTTYTDITERTRSENALRESEERHALALDGSNDGIWDWDVVRDEIHVSERLNELLGLERGTHRVSGEQWQARIHPDDHDHFRTTMQSHLRGENSYYVCEFRTVGHDGSERWVLHRGACIRDEDGRVHRMAGSMGDITQHKHRELELRDAKESAERALEELRLAQRNLVQAEKMAALGQLTAGIAHEIKNPLNFINNFSSTSIDLIEELTQTLAPGIAALAEDARADAKELLETLADDLDTIRQHGKRADGIVRSMLMHSREGSSQRAQTNLNALLDESINLAYHGQRASVPGFNVTLERDFDNSVGQLSMLPAELTRVFLNLLTNAFYAVRLREQETGAAYAPTVWVATRALSPERVEVRVRDNGSGIDSASLQKLFTPFFTTKPPGEGTGLGLSISHDIVVGRHGGSMRAISEPGVHTEFVIELPRTFADVA